MKIFLISIKYSIFILFFLFLAILLFILFHPVFGGRADKKSRKKIEASPNYNGQSFINRERVSLKIKKIEGEESFGIIDFLFPPKEAHRSPGQPLPTVAMEKRELQDGDFIWLGHSTTLFKTAGKTILFDPIYYNASPLSFFIPPFRMTARPVIEELPEIDALLISHDHYDHLDYTTIRKMAHKVKHFYVPLGVKAHLIRWKIAEDTITELDWYESVSLDTITFTLTPSRHFSGRSFRSKNNTLWGGWVVQSPSLSLFFSGDGGYGKHFAEIGKRFGPFDIALIENGQYNIRWADVHMLPKQSVQAAKDVQGKYILPVHWGKFILSLHSWKEPIEKFVTEAEKSGVPVLVPQIGERFTLQNPPTIEKKGMWWENIE